MSRDRPRPTCCRRWKSWQHAPNLHPEKKHDRRFIFVGPAFSHKQNTARIWIPNKSNFLNDQKKSSWQMCPKIQMLSTVNIRNPDCPVLSNSILVRLLDGPVFKRHSKTGQICPDFEWSGFQMAYCKSDPFVRFFNVAVLAWKKYSLIITFLL
jgi:hypothetical protein